MLCWLYWCTVLCRMFNAHAYFVWSGIRIKDDDLERPMPCSYGVPWRMLSGSMALYAKCDTLLCKCTGSTWYMHQGSRAHISKIGDAAEDKHVVSEYSHVAAEVAQFAAFQRSRYNVISASQWHAVYLFWSQPELDSFDYFFSARSCLTIDSSMHAGA